MKKMARNNFVLNIERREKTLGVTCQKQGEVKNGFTLVLSILVASLLLLAGVTIVNLTVKELQLSSAARESLIAFQSADSLLECVLSLDQRNPSPFGGVVEDIRGEEMEGYWRFDESKSANEIAIDLSGKGNNIPVFSNEIEWVDWDDSNSPDSNGIINNQSALSFPGDTSISLNDFEVIPYDGLTVAFWVHLDGPTNGAFVRLGNESNSLVVGIGGNPGDGGRPANIDSSGPALIIISNESEIFSYSSVFQNSGWYHVTLSIDSNNIAYRIFRLETESAYSVSNLPFHGLSSFTGIDVGGYTHTEYEEIGGGVFVGIELPRYVEAVIDDLRIYSRAFDEKEIVNLPKIGRELLAPFTDSDGNSSCFGIDLVSEPTGWDPVFSTTETSVKFTLNAPEYSVYGQAEIIKQLDNTNISIRGYNNDSDSPRRYERGLEAKIDPIKHQDVPQEDSLFLNMYLHDEGGNPPAENQIKANSNFIVGWNIIGNFGDIQCSHLGPIAEDDLYESPFNKDDAVEMSLSEFGHHTFIISCINMEDDTQTLTSVEVEIVED